MKLETMNAIELADHLGKVVDRLSEVGNGYIAEHVLRERLNSIVTERLTGTGTLSAAPAHIAARIRDMMTAKSEPAALAAVPTSG